mgnify:CR=1 FL=1
MFRCAKYFHDIFYNIENGSGDYHYSHHSRPMQGQGSVSNSLQPNDPNFLDRAYIRRWKTKIYRYLEKEEQITQTNFENYSEDSIFVMVQRRYKNEDIKK